MRRLPGWMANGAAADQNGKQSTKNKRETQLEDGLSSQACQSMAKVRAKRQRKGALIQKDTPAENLPPLANCKTKTSRRQLRKEDPHCDNSVSNDVFRKKARNPGGKAPEPDTPNLALEPSNDFDTSSQLDVEGELTVEDLVTIAEEYVKADGSTHGQEKQKTNGEPAKRFALPAANSSVDASEDFQSAPDSQRESNHERTTSSSVAESLRVKEESNHERTMSSSVTQRSTGKDIVPNTIARTGDPAQDMLGLFLGSLLNKPPEKKQTEFNLNELTFDCDLEKKTHSDSFAEPHPPTKKKSSLKDKVAMFFE